MRRFSILFAIPILFFLACSDSGNPTSPNDGGGNNDGSGDGGGTPPGDSTAVSFAADVLPVFAASCAVSGCHGSNSRAGNLSLAAADAYGSTVGVTSAGYAPILRVAAGDTASSVLYQKIVGNQAFGARMPYGRSPLSDADTETIRAWIEAGAKDD